MVRHDLLHGFLELCWLLLNGIVWAELGAKWPEAGGSYQFLRKLFGEKKWGSMFSFLFIWQTTIQAPLVIASGAIGFAQYFTYLFPMPEPWQQKAVSGLLVILITILLYRKISDVGKISVALWIGVLVTLLWLIIRVFAHFNAHLAFDFSSSSPFFSQIFFAGFQQATIKTVYSYLGYYNVCHLGGEIKNPEKNIRKAFHFHFRHRCDLFINAIERPWSDSLAGSERIAVYCQHFL